MNSASLQVMVRIDVPVSLNFEEDKLESARSGNTSDQTEIREQLINVALSKISAKLPEIVCRIEQAVTVQTEQYPIIED